MTHADLRSTFIDDRLSPFLRETHLDMLEAADLRGHSRVLVLECRDGWAAEEAWRRIRRGYVCGVDPSHAMITLAKQYRGVEGHLEFFRWDRLSLPFPDGSFETVLIPFSIHRFQEPGSILKEAARVLKPGGKALVLEATKYSFFGLYVFVDLFYRVYDPGHFGYRTAGGLVSLLGDAGFEDLRVLSRFRTLRSGGKLLANAALIQGRIPTSEGLPGAQ